jgi:hypothetical protein
VPQVLTINILSPHSLNNRTTRFFLNYQICVSSAFLDSPHWQSLHQWLNHKLQLLLPLDLLLPSILQLSSMLSVVQLVCHN